MQVYIFFDGSFKDWCFRVKYRNETLMDRRGYATKDSALRGVKRLITAIKNSDYTITYIEED